MATQAKYNSLPFIDSSGQDCFESGNDGIKSVTNDNGDFKSESVEHIGLDQSKSFSVFQNKYLDSSSIDFSDKILLSHKGGYKSKSVYEIIGEQVTKETPQQKYQRLQHELRELAEEVELIKASATTESKKESPVELSQQIKFLQKQLHDLHLEKVLGTEVLAASGVQGGTWTRQVLNQLETFKSTSATTKDGSEKDHVVYEMYIKPEHAKFAQTARISELEAKLKEIEQYVGKDRQKLQSVIADPNSASSTLMDVTASVHAKLTLFDINHVEIIAARLQGLLHCINEISQKKTTIEDVDNQTKINELHQLITNWDSVASVVPDLIERLKAINSLNEQATTFSQSLEHLTSTQTEVRDQLRTQKDSLEKFEKSFTDNVNSIQANCALLETRINSLMKKVGT